MNVNQEVVNLPDPRVQPLVHPLDLPETRRPFTVWWWLNWLLHPTVPLALAALLWQLGNPPIIALLVPTLMLSFAAFAGRYYAFALGYLAAAVLQKRQATWVVAMIGIGALAALRLQDLVEPTVVLLAAAVAFVLWGTARGRLWPPGTLMVETAGMVVFAAIALAAVSVDPDLGLYLVAAGWAGHAAWDFAHWRADKVVSRSFAEWCGVFDLLGAVGILMAAML